MKAELAYWVKWFNEDEKLASRGNPVSRGGAGS